MFVLNNLALCGHKLKFAEKIKSFQVKNSQPGEQINTEN